MIANPVPWPNGARCAVAFTFDMDADSILHLAHHTSADTRLAAMSMLRYGPEIAVPRLVELYKRFDMHQTFFLPAWCMERYPTAVDVILQGGHEIAGVYSTQRRAGCDWAHALPDRRAPALSLPKGRLSPHSYWRCLRPELVL